IGHIYVNHVSFSHRPEAMSLPPTTSVSLDKIKLEIQVGEREDRKAAICTLRVWTDPDDPKALYQFSVEMVATASAVEGEENLPPAEYLRTSGPATVYPFLRELVANITARGRFGPIWLKPFNFQALEGTWKGPRKAPPPPA